MAKISDDTARVVDLYDTSARPEAKTTAKYTLCEIDDTPITRLMPRRVHPARLHVACRHEQFASTSTPTAIRTRIRWTRV